MRSLVVLLMGGKDESNTGPSGDAQTKRAMRLKKLLDLIDSVDWRCWIYTRNVDYSSPGSNGIHIIRSKAFGINVLLYY